MDQKQVLVVYYTQTGQQQDILHHYLKPFQADENIDISVLEIELATPYPFPWKLDQFLDVFPESHQQISAPLKPISKEILSKKYDLILLNYQVWYLTPSIPILSFLKSKEARQLFKDVPVVTLVSCRNMWFMAQEKMKLQLIQLQANLVGHISLTDRNWNHISLITILHWMQTGRKDSKWGVFPKPGVSETHIKKSQTFAAPIIQSLVNDNFSKLQNELLNLGAVPIRPMLVFVDKRGNFIFSKWSKLIRSKGLPGDPKRKPYVKMFYYYLSVALWLIAPIVAVVYYIFYLPFLPWILKEKKYFKSIQYKN